MVKHSAKTRFLAALVLGAFVVVVLPHLDVASEGKDGLGAFGRICCCEIAPEGHAKTDHQPSSSDHCLNCSSFHTFVFSPFGRTLEPPTPVQKVVAMDNQVLQDFIGSIFHPPRLA
ncbi:hypothetical protein K8I61_16595 [bacterium]|nr:hypothetical protein [bacterium]